MHTLPSLTSLPRFLALVVLGLATLLLSASGAGLDERRVFLITTDGLRWEELFGGLDAGMLDREVNRVSGNLGNVERLKRDFWRETPEERREALFPFLWTVAARQGQLWGNRQKESTVRVANGFNFSYPGYSELLTGVADPQIDSNNKVLNPNTNVFEWLARRPAFREGVAAVFNWDVMAWILNSPRAGFPVWSAFDLPAGAVRLPLPPLLEETARRSPNPWSNVTLDTFIVSAALQVVRTQQPRAMYISYGETDDWAHEGHYERYIRAAHAFDASLRELWTLLESLPAYRGRTNVILTTDHGRGPAPVAWKNHGRNVTASPFTWLVAFGPHVVPLGERANTPLVTAGQVAATVAAAVGEDFFAGREGRVAAPVSELFEKN